MESAQVARWAKSIGASVIATVGSASKISTVKRWGLDHVLHIAEPRLAEPICALTAGVGADVVYDLVGRQTLDSSIEALRAGGVLVHAGNASGAVTADTQRLAARSIRYQQPATPQYVTPQNQDVAAFELFERYGEGALGPLTLTRYRLEEAAEAHHAIIQRKHSGSILLML
ncbi:zinc-binding dehydrogenase [Pseudomonas koreensis]|uniref:zinc-binding dehydrogenase n=1 Tax=Pseudomonas koreensis TaxID=198620 RepID=UPI001576926B